MTQEELVAAYALSARPYLEAQGPIPAYALALKSWRYFVELNSACNLRCALCISGNRKGYEHVPGFMDMDLLEKILDKIRNENCNSTVCPYGNGEPFLNPKLAECIIAIKKRGLRCEVATNLHLIENADRIISANPDFLIVSVSGFTQAVYEKNHRNGDIEKVKKNLSELAGLRSKVNPSLSIALHYHMYEDNLGDEMQKMKDLAAQHGFLFMQSWARAISMENTIQALRAIEKTSGIEISDYELGEDGNDWNKILPEANPDFIKNMERLRFHPINARRLYERFPIASVCIIGDVFTYIRHDGRVQVCGCTDDLRMTIGNYLEMSQEQISEARRKFTFCKECLRYRMNLYYHVVDCTKWDSGGQP